MRRLVAMSVLLIATVSATAGCTANSSPETWQPPGKDNNAVAPPSDAACASMRTVVTADMGPLGTALGAIVGRATAGDKSGQSAATTQAASALTKLGSDISSTGARSTNPAVQKAAVKTSQNLSGLASDPSFLSGITSMAGIADATTRLQQATAPVTTACGGG